jgi:hypothetical protein
MMSMVASLNRDRAWGALAATNVERHCPTGVLACAVPRIGASGCASPLHCGGRFLFSNGRANLMVRCKALLDKGLRVMRRNREGGLPHRSSAAGVVGAALMARGAPNWSAT